jgi:hypothetical protein
MKRITILLMAFLAFSTCSFAQEDESYTMFDNTRIVVKTDKINEFGAAMAEHNKKYHNDGPYHANVWSVTVGENAGDFIWSMGPCTFTELDGSPDGEDHLKDWVSNVMPNVERLNGSNMWRLDTKHSYILDDDGEGSSKLSISVFDIKDDQAYRFKDILDRVLKVYKEKDYKYSFTTYWPQFTTNSEEDVAIVSGFDKWARFDEDRNFKKDFIEVNGEGSWDNFLKDLRGTINGSKDEVWVLVKELSGE